MAKRVWEVCEPHPDVFSRDIDPSLFAASLHQVEVGTADPDYVEAERFFKKTYMTQSLRHLMEGVAARLLGLPGRSAPLLRLETPFGGGKTHTMVALYHLAKYAHVVEQQPVGEELRALLQTDTLPRDVRVVVLDGVALDPRGRQVDGVHLHTLWGELAYRLGGRALYEVMREADEARVAPGQSQLETILRGCQPLILLMDEVMDYLARASGVRVEESTLMAQTASFIRALTSAVGALDRAVMVVSLPASSLEVPVDDPQQAERMFQHMHLVLERAALIETPVAEDEVFGVLQRRLFKSVGTEQSARQAMNAFQDYYAEFARFFPDTVRSPQYRERMLKAYPFHPVLVDLLYQRWGPHPKFQRTRGALRLLALVMRRLWNQRPGSAYLIQPHHIDLADRYVRSEVVRLLESSYDAIITGDVNGRAREVDRELGGDYQREELAQGCATCALLYTVSASADIQGCTEDDLRVAMLRPKINPAQVSEVLKRLQAQLWYLRYRDRRYLFTARPNLNKVIVDHEQEVTSDQIDEQIGRVLGEISGRGRTSLQVLHAPLDPQLVNEPSQATLVILPLSLSDIQRATEWMKQVVGRVTRRNLLIFLAPDPGREEAVRVSVRRLLALQALTHTSLFRELEEEDHKEVQEQIRAKDSEIRGLLQGAYTRLFRPSPEGVSELRVMFRRDAQTLSEAVYAALVEQGLLVETLSPDYIVDVANVKEGPVAIVAVQTALTGSPDQPIVANPHEALKQTIREGVRKGQFAVQAQGQTFIDDVPEEVLDDKQAVLVPVDESKTEPPPPEQVVIQRILRVESSSSLLYPLKQLLESLQNKQGQVAMELRVQGSQDVLSAWHNQVSKLLNDYGIPHEWKEESQP